MKRLVLLVVLICAAFGGGVSAQDAELTDLPFFITFVPNIQFSPVYVAIDRGYFAEEGLNLVIEHGDEPIGVDLIAVGQRQFGLISGEQVIAARAQDRPVVLVHQWFQDYPVGVVFSANSGIEDIADLAGRTVGLPGRFGASYTGLIALLNAGGLSESDVSIQEIGFNAPEVFCVGAVEASAVYINNEPLQIANRAAAGDCGDVTEINVIPVADAANMVSNGVVTNEDTIANDPELVQAVVRAFDRGLRDAIANPAAAYLASLNYVLDGLPNDEALVAALEAAAAAQDGFLAENPDADRETIAARRAEMLTALQEQFDPALLLQFEVLLSSIELWDADQIGVTDPAAWETAQNTLIAMGFLEEPIDLAAAYTNAFVSEAE